MSETPNGLKALKEFFDKQLENELSNVVTFQYDASLFYQNRGTMQWKRDITIDIRHVYHRYDPEIVYIILECKQEFNGTCISNNNQKSHIIEIIFDIKNKTLTAPHFFNKFYWYCPLLLDGMTNENMHKLIVLSDK